MLFSVTGKRGLVYIICWKERVIDLKGGLCSECGSSCHRFLLDRVEWVLAMVKARDSRDEVPFFHKTLTETMVWPGTARNTVELSIPAKFVHEHGDKFHISNRLQGPSCRSLPVMAKIRMLSSGQLRSVSFSTGWKEFTLLNGLKKGDQLLFSLVAESTFVVRVMDRPLPCTHLRQVPSANLQPTESLHSRPQQGKSLQDTGMPHVITEQPQPCSDAELSSEDETVTGLFVTQCRPDLEKPEGASGRKVLGGGRASRTVMKSKNMVKWMKKAEKKKIKHQFPASTVVQFTMRLSTSAVHYYGSTFGARLTLPAAFVQRISHALPRLISLQGPKGGVWPVQCVTYQAEHKTSVHFKAGWGVFVEENLLEIGDELSFALTAPSHLDVHILRKAWPKKRNRSERSEVREEIHQSSAIVESVEDELRSNGGP